MSIIGPYGVGKSQFTKQKFAEAKEVTTFDLDRLKVLLMQSNSRDQDHHFEAMMLRDKLLTKLSEIPKLLTETAAIDQFRFNRLLTRDFSSRDQIVVEEVASENASDAVTRFLSREGVTDQTRLGAATTSANDALRYRSERIEMAKNNPKVKYTLYCNQPTEGKNATFLEVAKMQEGELKISQDQVELFKKLTSV